MRKRSIVRTTAPIAVVAALILAVTGCGGSKKSDDSTAATTPTVTTQVTTTETSSGGTGDKLAKSCVAFAGVASKLGQALGQGGAGSIDTTKKYFESLAAKAPSDIKGSFQTFADAFAKYIETIKGLDLKSGQTPSAEDTAKLQEAAKALSDPKVQAASQKIKKWVDAGCHS